MTARPNPHDAFFKAIFGTPEAAADAIRRLLPPRVADAIDRAGLEPIPTEFIDDTLGDRRADLAFKARIGDSEAIICLLFEHQSTPDGRMPLRLLLYMVGLWQHHLREQPERTRLPAILPIVLYHGDRPWSGPTAFTALLDLPPPLLDALRPPEIESRILATEDAERLRGWLRRVLAASRPEDVVTDAPG